MEFLKLVCRDCGNIEEVPIKIVHAEAVISCSSCGALIVETKGEC